MSELKNQKHVQMCCILSEPVGMSIIINSRNPAPKFKFCSVFSAKNPTVNDASYYVVCRGGDDFWCSAEQQQCAT